MLDWGTLNFSPKLEKLIGDFRYRTVIDFDRMLYDFFDEQGIIITTDYWPNTLGVPSFYCELKSKDFSFKRSTDYFPTRTQAESEAYKVAFQIIEKRLEGE